ncbi:MAG: hypothetical protein WA783_10780 [Phormidesmis sp.]
MPSRKAVLWAGYPTAGKAGFWDSGFVIISPCFAAWIAVISSAIGTT